MAWKLVYHAEEPDDPQVGDIWPEPHWANSNIISEAYKDKARLQRPPLVCHLPSLSDPEGIRFLLDRVAHGDKSRKGWEITITGPLVPGETPDITVKPSINCDGSYHGYIKHGVITDDCEGREYPGIIARKPA